VTLTATEFKGFKGVASMLEQILAAPWFWTFLAAIRWNLLFGVTGALFDEAF
jgi:hypothetical protein